MIYRQIRIRRAVSEHSGHQQQDGFHKCKQYNDYLYKIEASGIELKPLRAHLHKNSTNMRQLLIFN